MSITIKLPLGQLPFRIQKNAKAIKKVIKNGTRKAAEKSMRLLKSKTPVDLANAKNAWQVLTQGDTYIINNDSPYIGVLDRGARPHPVSLEGQELILAWIYRKQPGITEKAAKSMLWGIITNIKHNGVEGHEFMAATEEQRAIYLDEAMKAAVKEFESEA